MAQFTSQYNMFKITLSTTNVPIPIYTHYEMGQVTKLLNDPEVEPDRIIFCKNGYFVKKHFSSMVWTSAMQSNFQEEDPEDFVPLMEYLKKQDPKLAEKYNKLLGEKST